MTIKEDADQFTYFVQTTKDRWCCCGRNRMVVGFITTYAISVYLHSCEVYSINHYVIKFVSDLR